MTTTYHAPPHPGLSYPAFVDPQNPGRPHGGGGPGPRAFPRVDENLVRPETREEMVDGQLVIAQPANEPHGDQHYDLDFLTRGSLAPGYVGSTDLLTRFDHSSNFATDTCIRREGIDPESGARYLEELAFEIINTQSLASITVRARRIAARGVRRLIGIFVDRGEVREWSRELDDWVALDPNGVIEDPTLATPIPIRALLDRTAANQAVVQALYAKRDPAIMEIEAKGAQVARTAIAALCEVLEIPLDQERCAFLQALDATALERLLDEIRVHRRWP